MRILFSVILILFLNSSCQHILKKIYGVKNPEIENESSIKKAALKYGLDTANIVTLNSNDFLKELNGKAIPDASIYDSKGNYIEYRVTDTSCNAGLFDFIPNLNVNNNYNKPDSTNLELKLNKFLDLKGQPIQKLESADFYVLIYWTVWSGKLNKDHVKIWEDAAINNKNARIKVLKVNLDFQDHWDEADKKKIITGKVIKKK
jgi:hypothetical protein